LLLYVCFGRLSLREPMSDIAKRLEKAEKYLQKGKPDAALEEYLSILDHDPRNDAVRLKAADLCVTLNRTDEAARLLGELFDQESAAGDAAHAVITYKRLARSGHPTIDQTFLFAQLVEKTNRRDAIEAFEAAAKGFEGTGRKKDALAAQRRLAALDPSIPNFTHEGELAEALREAAVAADAFVHVGQLAHQTGEESLSWFERAHKLDSNNAEAALLVGQGYIEAGNASYAIVVLEPAIKRGASSAEIRDAYARALLLSARPLEAEPYVRELFLRDPARTEDMLLLIGGLIDAEQDAKALSTARLLEEQEMKRGHRREFINTIKEVADKHPPRIEFLEYLVEAFNSANREQDYCSTLSKLFDLYYAAGRFMKAGDALDRAAEVDPYEEGHQKRLEMLRGKIDANRFNAIANRFGNVVQAGVPAEQHEQKAIDSEPTVLEDLMLQAEIFLQYSMRSKAVERLERISKLFPREEEKNQKLRALYMNAGFLPKHEGRTAAASGPAATTAALVTPDSAPVARPASVPQAVADEAAVDNFSRVTEITRNIYRQGNVKGVLFTAVNDVGRHWNASRCVAGLCTPGRPPSAALEYCAPGVKPTDVIALVRIIGALQSLAVEQGVVNIENSRQSPDLAPIAQFVETFGIQSVLAVPLLDGDEHAGILIMQQCDATRRWGQTDVVVLKTIAEQMTLAVNNARLRSLMKTLAVTDEKSGLLKRSSYLDVLLSEVRRSMQQGTPMALMLMQFGSPVILREVPETVVENMMQQVGQTVCTHVRQNDVAVRYDRNTIAVLLSDTNDKNAFFAVDKLRKLLASTHAPGSDQPVPVTIGIAEALLQQRFDPIDIVTELINRAEYALESARAAGGNNAKSLAANLETAAVA
jgi:GAF domain-containing protein